MSPLAANAARLTRTKVSSKWKDLHELGLTHLARSPILHTSGPLQGYPYARPSSSFLYANGRPYIFDDGAWTEDVGSILVTGPEGTTER